MFAEICTSGRETGHFLLADNVVCPTIGNSLTYFRIESRTFEEEAFISDWSGIDTCPKMISSAIKTTRPRTPSLIHNPSLLNVKARKNA